MQVEKPLRNPHFPTLEEEIGSKWESDNTFQQSIQTRPETNSFNFFDGPPFATGLPHYGHTVASVIKDAFPRYFTMKGYRVERKFGWDCHGLPVEMLIQNELGLKSKLDIQDFGIAKFNDACRNSVLRYTKEWRKYITRLGRWVDMDNEYRTMDTSYMESVWAVFKKLWDKGLVYEGRFIMSYSAPLASTLSNMEASMDYRDIQDPSITVKAKIKNGKYAGKNLLVWTTTPWTLPANVAIVVAPKEIYTELYCENTKENYFILKPRIADYWPNENSYKIISEVIGQDLVGLSYEPFFPYYVQEAGENAFKIYGVDYVLTDTGTGAVHTAPAFGEDDFRASKQYNLPLIDHLDANGKFLPNNHPEVVGMDFKAGDKILIHDLKLRNIMFKHETIVHAYPMCWRSGTPLIYRAMPSWFVKADSEQMLRSNEQIRWVPEHLKNGRFGKWLENARDWNIARERYWGCPIPLWKNNETGETLCLGSVEELEKYAGRKITDLHMEFIDDIEIPSPTGKGVLKRVPYVFDCWFESGSMPYAQLHYPFENADVFHKKFPADFISEGLDQTRGWFYTLNFLSSALFDSPAFKNVVVNGMILANDGRKMSKSLKNYPDPMDVINDLGADAVRLYLLNSTAVIGEELRFSIDGVKESVRKIILPIWNAYSFFSTYASIDAYDPEKNGTASTQEIDKWIELRLNELLKQVNNSMGNYHLDQVCPAIVDFLDDLNNWYIRRSRRRFWNSDMQAYATLYKVLLTTSKVLAPFAPFIADYLYKKLSLTPETQKFSSVHLSNFPEAREISAEEKDLLEKFQVARRVVELGRNIRTVHKIKNRQPLKSLIVGVVAEKTGKQVQEMSELIQEELNVKSIQITTDSKNLAKIVVKPNLKILGRALGEKLKVLQSMLPNIPEELALLAQRKQTITFGEFTLAPEMLIVELLPAGNQLVAIDADIVAALDPEISPELKMEGMARELVSLVQKARKSAEFEVDDRVCLQIKAAPALLNAIAINKTYIEDETLSTLVENETKFSFDTLVKIEGEEVGIYLRKS